PLLPGAGALGRRCHPVGSAQLLPEEVAHRYQDHALAGAERFEHFLHLDELLGEIAVLAVGLEADFAGLDLAFLFAQPLCLGALIADAGGLGVGALADHLRNRLAFIALALGLGEALALDLVEDRPADLHWMAGAAQANVHDLDAVLLAALHHALEQLVMDLFHAAIDLVLIGA